MDILPVILLISSAASLMIGLVVLFKKSGSQLNKFFGIYGIANAIWVFATFMPSIQPDNIFWLKTDFAFGAVVFSFLLLWVSALCYGSVSKWRMALAAAGFVFFALAYSGDLILGEIKKNSAGGIYEASGGALNPLYSFYSIAILAVILYTLISSYLKATSLQKKQIGFILAMALIWGTTSALVSSILPLFGIVQFIFLDPALTGFFFAMISIVIIRYKLFDLKVILTEILTGLMGLSILILAAIMPTRTLMSGTLLILILFLALSYLLLKATYKELHAKEFLEQEVQKRTKELQSANRELTEREEELTKFYNLTVGRELRMTELKDELSKLKERQNGGRTAAGAGN